MYVCMYARTGALQESFGMCWNGLAMVEGLHRHSIYVLGTGPKSLRTAKSRSNPASPCGNVLPTHITHTVITSCMLVCAASHWGFVFPY